MGFVFVPKYHADITDKGFVFPVIPAEIVVDDRMDMDCEVESPTKETVPMDCEMESVLVSEVKPDSVSQTNVEEVCRGLRCVILDEEEWDML